MISDKRKQNIEECVVKIECINKLDDKDKEFGTGFFIDDKTIATASHVINKYYSNPDDYIINIIPIKAKDDNEIKVVRTIESKRNNYIAILEIEECVNINTPLSFTNGYEIKRGDNYYSFGYPSCKKDTGYIIENKISTAVNTFQSRKIDWDLRLTDERPETFQGLSGAPIIIDNMLVGIVQTESIATNKALSIGMSSIKIMKDYIPDKYYKEYCKIEHIQNSELAKENKIYSVEDIEGYLKKTINPPIGLDFFEIDYNEFKENFRQRLTDPEGKIFIIGKSREESLYCILNELKYELNYNNVIIVESKDSWEKLRDNITDAILIPNFYAGELIYIKGNINIFIYGEDEYCPAKDNIELRRRLKYTIAKKLEKAGLSHQEASDYIRNTNGLFIPLKRKLFNGQYNELPPWGNSINDSFIAALLCGKWSECDGDKEVIEILSGKTYDEFIKDLISYSRGGEPFIIEIHRYNNKMYQLANIEMAWELLDKYIDENLWDKFEALSYKVITKIDPIFYKPFDEHYKASFFVEKAENSNMLKLGMIRSMVFRGIYRNGNYQYEVDSLVKKILGTLDSLERWGYLSQFFTELCEASPKAVIDRLEEEIKKPTGLKELFTVNLGDIMFARHYYTHVLWAVEYLLLYKQYTSRAVKWLFAVDDMNIKYSISNSPRGILEDIFCTWYNISTLNTSEKISILKIMINKYKNTWDLIYNELADNKTHISNGINPHYRRTDDIKDATNGDVYELNRAYVNLCINNMKNKIDRLSKMISIISKLPEDILCVLLSKLESEITDINDINKSIIKDTLREEIYRHRYFVDAECSMDEVRVKKLEDLLESISFENPIYDYLYLFNPSYDMHILNPIPYNKESSVKSENDDLIEAEIRDGIQKFKENNLDLIELLKLADKSKHHNNLGLYIAKYYTESKFDKEIYMKMLSVPDKEDIICSYIYWIYRTSDNLVIEKVKDLSIEYENKKSLYIRILKMQNLNYKDNPYVMNESEEIKNLYWSSDIRRFNLSKNKETIIWCLENLMRYDNIPGYVEILYEGLDLLTKDELLKYMQDLKSYGSYTNRNTMESYYLNEIMKEIQNKFDGQYEKYSEIMSIELYLRNLMEWNEMKCTQYIFKEEPGFYAKMVDIIYLHEGEEKGGKGEEEQRLAKSLFDLYYKGSFCPCEKNGRVDLEELKLWVYTFKEILKQQKQEKFFNPILGRLFAYSPIGEDGYYPHESVREVIEEIADEELNDAYVTAEYNKRGIYSPNAGVTEKEMSLKYKANADALRLFYTETAKIYDKLYDSYIRQSINERIEEEDVIN